jgi:predicted RNase H-like HicB family nuclease
MNYTYTVILRKEPEGSYTVLVPALPGCLTYGDTIAEALRMAEEAIGCYLESLLQRGKPVPPDAPDVRLDMREMTEARVYRLAVEEAVAVV